MDRAGARVAAVITVAICDDHDMVREALAGVIDGYEDLRVVGTAESTETLRTVMVREHPEVAVIDIRLGEESGIEAARVMRGVSPETKVIMLTSFSNDAFLIQAHDIGASAFLLKSGTPDELVTAVRSVAAGDMLIDDEDVEQARLRLNAIS